MAELNPSQQAAAELDAPRILCLAPAGSGKTAVLTRRIARRIAQGVPPSAILAITFTVKAADEMRRRVAALVGPAAAAELEVHTFHAWAATVIRRHAPPLGLTADFTIIDEQDRRALVEQLAHELRVPCGPRTSTETVLGRHPKLAALYGRALVRQNATDYDGLEEGLACLLEEEDEVRADVRRLQHVLVDEFQDTSELQAAILELLAPPCLFMVGDPSQAIYAFRGARLENILEAAADPRTTVLRLSHNYRSGRAIVEAGNRIARAAGSPLGEVLAGRTDAGVVRTHLHHDDYEQAEAVAGAVLDALVAGTEPRDCMVLARTWAELDVAKVALDVVDVPAHLCRRTAGAWSTPAARALVAALRLVVNPRDMAALQTATSWPSCVATPAELTSAEVECLGGGSPVAWLAEHGSEGARRRLRPPCGPETDSIRVATAWAAAIGDEGVTLAPIMRLLEWAERRGTAPVDAAAFLAWVAQQRVCEVAEDAVLDGVRLMTVHAAKGLEAAVVHLLGVDEGAFPRADAGPEHDEERRLFYVAVTRACDELHVHSCAVRSGWRGEELPAGPSAFVGLLGDGLAAAESAP